MTPRRVIVALEKAFFRGARGELELSLEPRAPFTIIPKQFLEALGVLVRERAEFEVSSGRIVERGLGEAHFFFWGREVISPVVFGEAEDPAVLGFVTLAAMGLEFDFANNEIRSVRKLLAAIPSPPVTSALPLRSLR